MTNKEVKDIYSEEKYLIDEDTRKLYSYNNDNQVIHYSAKASDADVWIDYLEHGTVDNIEDRLQQWNNPVRYAYAKLVDFDSDKNDADHKIWDKVVANAINNQDKLFTKSGNWRKTISIDVKKNLIKVDNHE